MTSRRPLSPKVLRNNKSQQSTGTVSVEDEDEDNRSVDPVDGEPPVWIPPATVATTDSTPSRPSPTFPPSADSPDTCLLEQAIVSMSSALTELHTELRDKTCRVEVLQDTIVALSKALEATERDVQEKALDNERLSLQLSALTFGNPRGVQGQGHSSRDHGNSRYDTETDDEELTHTEQHHALKRRKGKKKKQLEHAKQITDMKKHKTKKKAGLVTMNGMEYDLTAKVATAVEETVLPQQKEQPPQEQDKASDTQVTPEEAVWPQPGQSQTLLSQARSEPETRSSTIADSHNSDTNRMIEESSTDESDAAVDSDEEDTDSDSDGHDPDELATRPTTLTATADGVGLGKDGYSIPTDGSASSTGPGQAAFYRVMMERDVAQKRAHNYHAEVRSQRAKIRELTARLHKSVALVEVSYNGTGDEDGTTKTGKTKKKKANKQKVSPDPQQQQQVKKRPLRWLSKGSNGNEELVHDAGTTLPPNSPPTVSRMFKSTSKTSDIQDLEQYAFSLADHADQAAGVLSTKSRTRTPTSVTTASLLEL